MPSVCWDNQTGNFAENIWMPQSPPPLKIPFSQRRDREFLYLSEIALNMDSRELREKTLKEG